MFTLYLASAIAAIGWAAVALVFSQRDGKTKVLAKYTALSGSSMGGAVTSTNENFYEIQPFPACTLVIYIVLAILPTLAVIISQTWLAIVFLIVFALIIFIAVRSLIKNYPTLLSTPIFIDKKLLSGSTEVGSAASTQKWTDPHGNVTKYVLVRLEQSTTAITILALALPLIWIAVTWLLTILGLQDWYLIGAINIIGFALSFVVVLFLRMFQ